MQPICRCGKRLQKQLGRLGHLDIGAVIHEYELLGGRMAPRFTKVLAYLKRLRGLLR